MSKKRSTKKKRAIQDASIGCKNCGGKNKLYWEGGRKYICEDCLIKERDHLDVGLGTPVCKPKAKNREY